MASRRTFAGRAGRLLQATGTAAVAAVAVAGVALFLVLGVLPRTGTYRTLTVLSGSMRPTIDPGSVVVVRSIDLRDVRRGDVLTFEAPIDGHPTVTHRVIEVVRGGDRPLIRTQGDANSAADPWIAELGPGRGWRVMGSAAHLGRAINAAQSPVGHRIIRFGMPALFLVVWFASLLEPNDEPNRDPTVLWSAR